ncbi:MAG: protein kinase [Lachnospiraceae bacterium]|nr:protein kinase [Lachnospiraceae bacterium]
MKSLWKIEEITSILEQLDKDNKPFYKYRFKGIGKGLSIIGEGASALVFDAENRYGRGNYVIKVIGFGNDRVDPGDFYDSCSMQKELQSRISNVVKIYDSEQIKVRLGADNVILEKEMISLFRNLEMGDNDLLLQFIVMEKLTPVIEHDLISQPRLIPRKLASFDKGEILKLAYDVGLALNEAHKSDMLHRDIKPENVFYCEKTKHYKLGDFGIAKRTYDGFASTCAFTRGYGAPEVVGTLDDKYDKTADIYSFGMMLFVLFNELKFPESDSYRPSLDQYKSGFFSFPAECRDPELAVAISKMTEFDPDRRQQSMEVVLNDIERAIGGSRLKYKKVHLSTSVVMGIAFAIVGTVLWKLSFGSDLWADAPALLFVAALACITKMILKINKKSVILPNIGIFLIGVIYIIANGPTWYRILVLFLLMLFDILPGIAGIMFLITNGITLISGYLPESYDGLAEFRWITVLLFSLSLFMIYQYIMLNDRSYVMTRLFKDMKLFWGTLIMFYILCMIIGIRLSDPASAQTAWFIKQVGSKATDLIRSFDLFRVGGSGLVFCIIWIIRERIMAKRERYKIW